MTIEEYKAFHEGKRLAYATAAAVVADEKDKEFYNFFMQLWRTEGGYLDALRTQ